MFDEGEGLVTVDMTVYNIVDIVCLQNICDDREQCPGGTQPCGQVQVEPRRKHDGDRACLKLCCCATAMLYTNIYGKILLFPALFAFDF